MAESLEISELRLDLLNQQDFDPGTSPSIITFQPQATSYLISREQENALKRKKTVFLGSV